MKYFPLLDDVREALAHLGSVSIAARLPIGDMARERGVFGPPGVSDAPAVLRVVHEQVDSTYFSTLGAPLVAGRTFTVEDKLGAPWVVILSKSLATRWFGRTDAIGRRIRFDGKLVEVIGVAPDIRRTLHENARPTLYTHIYQDPSPGFVLMLRTTVGSAQGILRRTVERVLPQEVVAEEGSLQSVVDRLSADVGMMARGGAAASGVSMSVFVLALMPVCTEIVRSRRREYWIRAAVGATPLNVRARVFWTLGRPIMGGASVGVLVATLLLTFVRTQVSLLAATRLTHLAIASGASITLMALTACVATVLTSVGRPSTSASRCPGRAPRSC